MKKITAVAGIVGVFIAAAASFIGIGVASDRSEMARVEPVAAHFHPSSGWVQDDNRVTGTFLCMGVGSPCNSILRGWSTDHHIALDEFQRLIRDAGWDLPIQGDCKHPGGTPGLLELCSAQGIVDSYSVRLAIVNEDAKKPDRVALRIVKITS